MKNSTQKATVTLTGYTAVSAEIQCTSIAGDHSDGVVLFDVEYDGNTYPGQTYAVKLTAGGEYMSSDPLETWPLSKEQVPLDRKTMSIEISRYVKDIIGPKAWAIRLTPTAKNTTLINVSGHKKVTYSCTVLDPKQQSTGW